MEWNILETDQYIDLNKTLYCGQTFNFHQTSPNIHCGVINHVLFKLKQSKTKIYYQTIPKISKSRSIKILKNFFTLDINYTELLEKWNYEWFPKIHGLRLLRLELIPTVFTFICSQNNNIKRITKMVNFLYSLGEFIAEVDNIKFYTFPSLYKLLDADLLKKNKFGYRAMYIAKSAKQLIDKLNIPMNNIYTNNMNNKLLNSEYSNQKIDDVDLDTMEIVCANRRSYTVDNKEKLDDYINLSKLNINDLYGVGRKVADCIKLLSMNDHSSVPVDVNIFKISKKIFDLKYDKINKKIYLEIQNKFRDHFGKYAGIAQLFLFYSSINNEFKYFN